MSAIKSVKPVLFIDLNLHEGALDLLSNASKNISYGLVYEGEIRSTDEAYPFKASVVHGFDTLTTLKAGSGKKTTLDCFLYAKTPSGKGVHIRYGGVVKSAEGYVTSNPSFEFDDDIEPQFRWVYDYNFIGKGKFITDEQGNVRVQYSLHIVE